MNNKFRAMVSGGGSGKNKAVEPVVAAAEACSDARESDEAKNASRFHSKTVVESNSKKRDLFQKLKKKNSPNIVINNRLIPLSDVPPKQQLLNEHGDQVSSSPTNRSKLHKNTKSAKTTTATGTFDEQTQSSPTATSTNTNKTHELSLASNADDPNNKQNNNEKSLSFTQNSKFTQFFNTHVMQQHGSGEGKKGKTHIRQHSDSRRLNLLGNKGNATTVTGNAAYDNANILGVVVTPHVRKEQRIKMLEEELHTVRGQNSLLQSEVVNLRNHINKLNKSMEEFKLNETNKSRFRRIPGLLHETLPNQMNLIKSNLIRHAKPVATKQFLNGILLKNHYFKHLEPGQIREIVECMYPKIYANEETVYSQNDIGDFLFIVESGKFQLFNNGLLSEGEVVIGELIEGCINGEGSLLYNCVRSVSCKCVMDGSRVWVLEKSTFHLISIKTVVKRQKEYVELLKNVPILSGLSQSNLLSVIDIIQEVEFKKGQVVYRHGQLGTTFFIVKEGSVSLCKINETLNKKVDDDDVNNVTTTASKVNSIYTNSGTATFVHSKNNINCVVVKMLGRGGYFGEKCLLSEERRTYDAVAGEADGAVCLCIECDDFSNLIQQEDVEDEIKIVHPPQPMLSAINKQSAMTVNSMGTNATTSITSSNFTPKNSNDFFGNLAGNTSTINSNTNVNIVSGSSQSPPGNVVTSNVSSTSKKEFSLNSSIMKPFQSTKKDTTKKDTSKKDTSTSSKSALIAAVPSGTPKLTATTFNVIKPINVHTLNLSSPQSVASAVDTPTQTHTPTLTTRTVDSLNTNSITSSIKNTFGLKSVDYFNDMSQLNNNNLNKIKDDLNVNMLDDLKNIATLGTGTFSRVDLVILKKNPTKTFALKQIKKRLVSESNQQERVLSEKRILSQCNSDFIIKIYKTFKDRKFVYILMEACLGGELWSILSQQKHFDDRTTRFYAASAVEAIQYLHKNGIIYRDLKPENMMLDELGYGKLVDFGCAKKLGNAKKTWTFCGTTEYVAPEVILNKGYDGSVDYWSLGIFVYELMVGKPPFTGSDSMKTYNMILKGLENMMFPVFLGKNATSLIKKLCKLNPNERLGYSRGNFLDVKKHKWYDGFDWVAFLNKEMRAPHQTNAFDLSNFDLFPKDDEIPPDDMSGWDKDF